MVVMVMKEWLSIAEIADKSGIPENTARRYVGKFSDFIQVKSTGRAKKYPPDTIQVVERISQLYQAGKSTDEIYELLSREQPLVVEVVEESTPSLSLSPYEVMEEFRRTNALILSTMQQVTRAVETMTAQQQELVETRRKMDELKDQVRERDSREKELLSRIHTLEEEQKKDPAEKRQARITEMITLDHVKGQLRKEAAQAWSQKPESERMRRTGIFGLKKEEDHAARDRFLQGYVDDHLPERLAQEYRIDKL